MVDILHGVKVADPYRWLEDLDSAETRAWLDSETALTRRWMARLSTRERIARELAAALDYERSSLPRMRGERTFLVKNSGLQDQPVLYVADSPTGKLRPLLDFNRVSSGGTFTLAGLSVSPRGTYVAYGLSAGGSDWVEWRVRDVENGRDLPDRIQWTKYYRPAWTGNEDGFYYSSFPPPEAGEKLTARDLDCKVRLHRLGTDVAADPVVYQRPDHPTWQFALDVTDDGRYLVIRIADGQVEWRGGTEEIHVVDLEARKAKPVPLATGFDAEYRYITSEGSTFFLKTTYQAPNGRIIAVDVRNPKRSSWRTIVPSDEAPINATARAGDRLIVATLVDVSSRLHAYDLDGQEKTAIPLPGIGTAVPIRTPRDQRTVLYGYSSFATPWTTYRHDLTTGRRSPIRQPKAGAPSHDVQVRQVFYASKDGTRIPMFLVHQRGLVPDGKNPTYLTGYGGAIVAMTPRYDPFHAWWVRIGGVLAIPGLRGGSEYGEAWARAAQKTRKQVTFDDFLAAAEWLIAEKITSPGKLAIAGASNGGLLVGAALTQRPDLFGAVLVEVGVLDMLRFHLAGQGAGWQQFYGSPEVAEEFHALLAYSPVHNVRPGTQYPAVLVVTGENDTRVVPWHSYKFVAALQAAQAGTAPILLHLESSAGHGGGTMLSAEIQSRAEQYAFLLETLNVRHGGDVE